MHVYKITSDAMLSAVEPLRECLISCEINVGTTMNPAWEKRTYHATRLDDRRFVVHVGGPSLEEFPTWHNVCDWLRRLGPRALEVLA